MNGTIPGLAGPQLAQGYVTYGSDSGHQAGGFGGGPADPALLAVPGFGGAKGGPGGVPRVQVDPGAGHGSGERSCRAEPQ